MGWDEDSKVKGAWAGGVEQGEGRIKDACSQMGIA